MSNSMVTTLRFLVLMLISALVFTTTSCDRVEAAEASSEEIRQVRTEQVSFVEYAETIRATGRLADRQQLRLSFKTGGVVREIGVEEGDVIRKGQALARLELDEINAQNKRATLGVEKAQIDLRNAALALQLAERDFRNAEGLYKDSVATLEQLENAEVQLENAKNQLEAAEKGLNLSERSQEIAAFNLRYASILAPSSGTILAKLAEPGEIVGPGTPILLLGTQSRTKVLQVNLTDRQIVQLKEGLPAKVTFDAFPGQVFSGTIDELGVLADPYTGTYKVEIGVENRGQSLLSGLIGETTFRGAEVKKLFRISIDALVKGDGRRGEIYVVEDKKAVLRSIQIFKIEEEYLLVEGGVNIGDEVITSGVGYLNDGMDVIIGE